MDLRKQAKAVVFLVATFPFASSCSGPLPLTTAILPEHDSAYLERLNTHHFDGRTAYLTWKAEETGRSSEDLAKADEALSSTKNPFDAYANADAVSRGAVIYKYHCARCHGDDARGHGPSALATHPANDFRAFSQRFASGLHRGAPRRWFKSISEGFGDPVDYPDEPRGPAMPAFGDKLTREQIWLVITYLQTLDARAPQSHGPTASK